MSLQGIPTPVFLGGWVKEEGKKTGEPMCRGYNRCPHLYIFILLTDFFPRQTQTTKLLVSVSLSERCVYICMYVCVCQFCLMIHRTTFSLNGLEHQITISVDHILEVYLGGGSIEAEQASFSRLLILEGLDNLLINTIFVSSRITVDE